MLRDWRIPRWLSVGADEARRHATFAAIIMWVGGLALVLAGPGTRSVLGPLKGGDFIFFYTLGHVSGPAAAEVLYDPEALHALQVSLLPESAPERYLPVYPPHAALLFRPLAALPYGVAALVWAMVVVVVYAACIWVAWRPSRHHLDGRLVLAAAAAFPPFWFLVLHGQSTVVPLAAFCLAWLALERGWRFLAGMALGLLLLKPQFTLVLVPLALVCREGRLMLGAATAIALQLAAIVGFLGPAALTTYARVIAHLPSINPLLEPRPEQMHSISAVTGILPGPLGGVLWLTLSGLVVARAIQIWRSPAALDLRMAALVTGSLLVNPHVIVYDVSLFALPLVWGGGRLTATAHPAVVRFSFGTVTYWFFVLTIAPTAAILPFQASVALMAILFLQLSTLAVRVSARDQAGISAGQAIRWARPSASTLYQSRR